MCVCVQEAEAARTLQAQGTIAELQRQLVSGAGRAQYARLRVCTVGSVSCVLCITAVCVLCVWSHAALGVRLPRRVGLRGSAPRHVYGLCHATLSGRCRARPPVLRFAAGQA